MTGQDAVYVAVHDGGGNAEGDRSDGGGRVVADTLEGADPIQGIREGAGLRDLFRGGVQVAGAAVVTEALPEPQDLVFRGCGKALHVRETVHETLPIGASLCNAGLLQDDFAEPDGIRVSGPPPGQVTAVIPVPVEDRFSEMHQTCRFLFSRTQIYQKIDYLCRVRD